MISELKLIFICFFIYFGNICGITDLLGFKWRSKSPTLGLQTAVWAGIPPAAPKPVRRDCQMDPPRPHPHPSWGGAEGVVWVQTKVSASVLLLWAEAAECDRMAVASLMAARRINII